MNGLLDEDKLRDGFTALFLAWKAYENNVEEELRKVRRELTDLRTLVEEIDRRTDEPIR